MTDDEPEAEDSEAKQPGDPIGEGAYRTTDLPPGLPEIVAEAVADSPPEVARMFSLAIQAAYQGMVPPASFAREWEELLPGSARELLDMHKEEQAHRQSLDRKVVGEIVASSRWGRFVGTGVVVVFLAAGFVLVWTGHETGGYGSLAIGATWLLATFLNRLRQPGGMPYPSSSDQEKGQ